MLLLTIRVARITIDCKPWQAVSKEESPALGIAHLPKLTEIVQESEVCLLGMLLLLSV